jgi:hypothetical protein
MQSRLPLAHIANAHGNALRDLSSFHRNHEKCPAPASHQEASYSEINCKRKKYAVWDFKILYD